MIISLVTLIIILFSGGGPDSFFLVPDGQKIIKTQIVDKEKANDAVVHYKAASKAIKAFSKQNKKDRKELVKLQSDRNTTRSTLEKKYTEAFGTRKQLQEELADTRLKIRDLMTEDEWDAFILDALAALEKKEKKTQKQDSKADNTAQKNLDKINTAITQEVNDEQRQKEALDAFSMFEGRVLKLVQKINTLKFNTNATLQSYSTKHQELVEIYNEMNSAQDEAFKALLNMRDELLQDITVEEWNSISKKLKSVF
jgi:hypothetical protein